MLVRGEDCFFHGTIMKNNSSHIVVKEFNKSSKYALMSGIEPKTGSIRTERYLNKVALTDIGS